MPITLIPFVQGVLCYGSTWHIADEAELALLVGRVLMGQYRHVAKILAGTDGAPLPSDKQVIDNAIALLSVPPGKDPWHRDGLLFQTISWIAAHRSAPAGTIIRAPHLVPAHKGFDGLQLELETAGDRLAAVVIFEDKATDHPRDTIRDEVWPEIANLEVGRRQNELTQEVTALLETRSGANVDAAIESILWKQVRRYRVSITIGDAHSDESGRERLFDGYDTVVRGDSVARRRGETFHVPRLRPWLDSFSRRVIAALQRHVPEHV